MFRRFVPLALLMVVASAGVAPAQYFTFNRSQQFYFAYMRSPLGGFYFNTYQSYNFSYSAVANGRYVSFSQSFAWNGPPVWNPTYFIAPVYTNPYDSLLSGGSGSYGSYAYNPIVDQQRANILRAQRMPDWDTNSSMSGKKDDFDNWQAAQADRGVDPVAGPVIDPNLIDAPAEAILSGKTLNELAALCLDQEKKGRKAESGLCPPDLLEKVVFEGGGTAAALNLFRQSKPPYPAVTVVPETEKLRAAIDAPFAEISKALTAAKRPNLAAVDKFDAGIRAARAALAERMKDASFAHESVVNDFLNQLELAGKGARDPATPSAFVPAWQTTGATVAELIRHMAKFKLRFAHAPEGGEPAYFSLHRGLLAYYARLTPVKK